VAPAVLRPATRRYQGFMADNSRWDRFTFRPDDVVISTPAKCGTTWMQTIVGMLLHDRVDLGAPISTISPWLDIQIRTDDEVLGLLARQTHRRFIKTHTPLDGVPLVEGVTYLTVTRHPLDAALSDFDHGENMRGDHVEALRVAASGEPPVIDGQEEVPEDVAEFLRWFIDNHEPPTGSGPHGLEDYCHQVLTYWDARNEPNVLLFHYSDMWADLDGQMRRVSEALGVRVDERRWREYVDAASLDSMRSRATHTAPEADKDLWESTERFFRVGGRREWASLLTVDELAHFDERLRLLAGDATEWAVNGWGASSAP
jgi:aryl sulfotransferase